MLEYILNATLWTLAIYGLIEILKQVIYTLTHTRLTLDGIYVIVATKNQEKKIEGFLRSFLFKIIYGKEENIKDIIIVDLNSTDNTKLILDKMSKNYDNIKISNWRDCKKLIDNIDEIK